MEASQTQAACRESGAIQLTEEPIAGQRTERDIFLMPCLLKNYKTDRCVQGKE